MHVTPQFWTHIDTLGGSINEPAAAGVAARLAGDGLDAVWQFESDLNSAVAMLETPAFDLAARTMVDDGTGLQLSDDTIETLRWAVIIAGRDRFEEVVESPEALAGEWNLDDAEDLMSIVGLALDPEPNSPQPTNDPHTDPSRSHVGVGAGASDVAVEWNAKRDDKWVDVGFGFHVPGQLPDGKHLHSARYWDRIESGLAEAPDPWLKDAKTRGVIPRLVVDIHYDRIPPDPRDLRVWDSEQSRVRRHRDRWEVRLVRDITRMADRAAIEAEVDAVIAAVKSAVEPVYRKSSPRRP